MVAAGGGGGGGGEGCCLEKPGGRGIVQRYFLKYCNWTSSAFCYSFWAVCYTKLSGLAL